MKIKILALSLLLSLGTMALCAADGWQEKLQKELPLLGHRNWIVVADSAYPLQTAPGIETIYVAADQLEVVKGVLAELAKTKHVKPTIYTDAELKFVAEKNAPGIGAYREALQKILANQPAQVLPHEQIIGKLDEAGKTFKVLLIKTPLTQPYTSVFFQLECGYWNAGSEAELRQAMK
jgi:D-ribose pyranose/furanose isomerase RbsD